MTFFILFRRNRCGPGRPWRKCSNEYYSPYKPHMSSNKNASIRCRIRKSTLRTRCISYTYWMARLRRALSSRALVLHVPLNQSLPETYWTWNVFFRYYFRPSFIYYYRVFYTNSYSVIVRIPCFKQSNTWVPNRLYLVSSEIYVPNIFRLYCILSFCVSSVSFLRSGFSASHFE